MQERSGIQTNKPTLSLDSEHGVTPQSSRRKFLTKASVGIVVASLPARSVWARDGGVAQSIVASGHGSDFADGKCIQLLSRGKWGKVNKASFPFLKEKFQDVFSSPGTTAVAVPKNAGTNLNPTLAEVVATPSIYQEQSVQIVAMVLNAYYSGQNVKGEMVYYPILESKNITIYEFAQHLYSKSTTPGYAAALGTMIDDYHSGSTYGECIKP